MKLTKILSLSGVLVLTVAIVLTLVISAGSSNQTSYLKTNVAVDSKNSNNITFYGMGGTFATYSGINLPGVPSFVAESEKNALTSTTTAGSTRFLLSGNVSPLALQATGLKSSNAYADALISDFLKRAATQEITVITTSADYSCSGGFYNQ
jgi:hypothetical protein